MKKITKNVYAAVVTLTFSSFAFLPATQAVEPAAPDTPLAGGNTADGHLALSSLTTGLYNSAFGIYSLLSNGAANFNTGVGAGALLTNTGNENTATGAGALFSNTTTGGNTADGAFALFSNTIGSNNTAVGDRALLTNSEGVDNTAVGFQALLNNTKLGIFSGDSNTAVGAQALESNTVGIDNTATGALALQSNVIGIFNTADGQGALQNNTGDDNTATGAGALLHNLAGTDNTAAGSEALFNNTTGINNAAFGSGALFANIGNSECTAVGFQALHDTDAGGNTAVGYGAATHTSTGGFNTAVGRLALVVNTAGGNNTAIGQRALQNSTVGNSNIAVGADAGNAQTTMGGSNNIYIGDTGIDGESNVIRIGYTASSGTPYTDCAIGGTNNVYIGGLGANIYIPGVGSGGNFSATVKYDALFGQLGVQTSSKRFKKDIDPMGDTSEAIYSLKPVTFYYKNDKTKEQQWGLIAEDVAKVNPALIGVDKEGKPFCVQYDKINAMLLNEFLKEHKKVEAQQATFAELKSAVAQQQKSFQSKIAEQEKQIAGLIATVKEQATQIQKVSAQVEISTFATKMVLNNP